METGVARFSRQKVIGIGFAGEVWAAKDSGSGEMVAIKTLTKELYDQHELPFPPLEVKLASSLCHPNIVRVLEVLEEPDSVVLVQEYISGGDLFSCMEQAGIFSEFLARCCFKDLISGVEYLHGQHVVHRDLKPENCVVDENGTLKIIDFGLAARFLDGELLSVSCGSPEYAAPEVMRDVPYEGPPIDLWALGVILYDMVMGDLPFGLEPMSYELPFLEDELGEISEELTHLLRHLLAEKVTARATMADVKRSSWMHLRVEISRYSGEPELMSISGSMTSSSGSSLSHDSPLLLRAQKERRKLVEADMGFADVKKNLFKPPQ